MTSYKRPVEISAAKDESVTIGFEADAATKVLLQELAMPGGASEFESQGRDAAIGPLTTDTRYP